MNSEGTPKAGSSEKGWMSTCLGDRVGPVGVGRTSEFQLQGIGYRRTNYGSRSQIDSKRGGGSSRNDVGGCSHDRGESRLNERFPSDRVVNVHGGVPGETGSLIESL